MSQDSEHTPQCKRNWKTQDDSIIIKKKKIPEMGGRRLGFSMLCINIQ